MPGREAGGGGGGGGRGGGGGERGRSGAETGLRLLRKRSDSSPHGPNC